VRVKGRRHATQCQINRCRPARLVGGERDDVVSGCGHAGIINTLEYAREVVRQAPVVAAVGGFHLFGASDATLEWTGNKLKLFNLQYLLGAHCTGIEAVYRLRAMLGLTRKTAVVGAVGSSFTLETGISALSVAG
jgi:7,8-dihydropterin-6-yl-methyl-4-(beta-D-ribofuranosyl)aminobenzene 5'-phosphate synthase